MPHELPANMLDTCSSNGFMVCLLEWANNVTIGWFVPLVFLGFLIVIFMATAHYGSKRAFGYAGFTSIVGSIWLIIAGLIYWTIGSIFIVVGIIAIVIMVMDER